MIESRVGINLLSCLYYITLKKYFIKDKKIIVGINKSINK